LRAPKDISLNSKHHLTGTPPQTELWGCSALCRIRPQGYLPRLSSRSPGNP